MKTLSEYKTLLEAYLEALPITGAPNPLHGAMRYSLLGGGKRLRGCLLLAAAEMASGNEESIKDTLPFAAALEMIHAYSLIHDDLPAMDNDTLRRGKPTNHVVYGEAVAILAGDGLLTFAFETMLNADHPRALPAIREIAAAAGVGGMLAGQTLDVCNEGSTPDIDLVRSIHEGKTAALMTAPLTAGLILGGADDELIRAGRDYGYHLGMAFQIVDDLLDLEGDPALMGKTLGKDTEEGKLTWPACVGEVQAWMDAETHIRAAAEAFAPYGERAVFFRDLAFATLNRRQ